MIPRQELIYCSFLVLLGYLYQLLRYYQLSVFLTAFKKLAVYYFGAFNLRSAGCIINDYFDRDLDKMVERTKERPFANGSLPIKTGFKIFGFHLLMGAATLLFLDYKAIYLSLMIFPVAMLYPLAKRYTYYPQLVLGIAFNSGILITNADMYQDFSNLKYILPFYFSSILWTVIYDTVYGFMDIKDDKIVKNKSLAIRWEHNPLFYFKISNLIMHSLLLYGGYINNYSELYYSMVLLGCIYYHNIITKIDTNNISKNLIFFKNNQYYGIYLILIIILERLYNKKIKQNN